jgi:hypothetical protein
MSPGRRTADGSQGQFYAAAVYGSIIAAAFLAAFRQEHDSAEATLFALLSTLTVFWIAHVWSTIVGERVHLGGDFDWGRVRVIGRSEWPLVESAFLPAVPLLLGWVGVLGRDDAALILCLVQLLAWGLAVGRSTYDRWWQALLVASIDTALGVAVILLELHFVH